MQPPWARTIGVDVRIREFDGRWLAVADLAGEPELGLGQDPREALCVVLAPLGPQWTRQLAAGIDADRAG